MIQNPFLTPPQVASPQSDSWAMGFAFGFQGPALSTMTPADIDPSDADAFNTGVLAGQSAAIDGVPLANSCVDLNSEGPSVPHLEAEGTIEGGMILWSIFKLHHFVGAIAEGVLLIVNLSLALETFSDDPDEAIEGEAAGLQRRLEALGITSSMELFLGGALDPTAFGCELKLTSIFRSQEAAVTAALALGRTKWLVVSWRTDQSGGVHLVASNDGN